jgi:hypothetical protein
MALYASDSSGMPNHLIDQAAQTSALALRRPDSQALSECGGGGLEVAVPKGAIIEPGDYWFFFIASADLKVQVQPARSEIRSSQDDLNYAELEEMPDVARAGGIPLRSSIEPLPSVYIIQTPPPP